MLHFLFTLAVFQHPITYKLLEVKRAFLHPRVQFTVDKNSGVEIPLHMVAEIFVSDMIRLNMELINSKSASLEYLLL